MLAQHHAGSAEDAGQDEHQAQPPHGVEPENLGKDEQGARHAADGRRVGRDFPPDVDDGANHLDEEGGKHNARNEMVDVQTLQRPHTHHIAKDADDVGAHAPPLLPQFQQRPPLRAAVKVDEEGGQQDGEEIDHGQHQKPIGHRQEVQIAESEQGYQTYQGQIERGENEAH